MLTRVPVDRIVDSPFQCRFSINRDIVASALAAIRSAGDYPENMAILVRPAGEVLEVVSGHHRLRAAREAGLTSIWAFVQPMEDKEAAILVAATNSHREMLPVEHGAHLAMLVEKFGTKVADYATLMGKGQRWGYMCLNAHKALLDHGGFDGPYADVPALVLEEVRRLPALEKQRAVLEHYQASGAKSTVINQVVTLVKDGARVDHAFAKVARSRKRVTAVAAEVLEADRLANQASSMACWAVGGYTRATMDLLEGYMNLLEATNEALEEMAAPILSQPGARERLAATIRAKLEEKS